MNQQGCPFLPRTLQRRLLEADDDDAELKVHWNQIERDPLTRRNRISVETVVLGAPFSCPFCGNFPKTKHYDAMAELWKHCLRAHLNSMFDYVDLIRDSGGLMRLLCRKNSLPFLPGLGSRKACPRHKPKSELLYCRPRKLRRGRCGDNSRKRKRNSHDGTVQPLNAVPLPELEHQYVHGQSSDTITEPKWFLELKSEDELDDTIFLNPLQNSIIDDHFDVTPSQKQFMRIWNTFLAHQVKRSQPPLKYTPRLCLLFVEQYARQLRDTAGLEQELQNFLSNLCDEGYIEPDHQVELLGAYNTIVDKNAWKKWEKSKSRKRRHMVSGPPGFCDISNF